MSPTSCLASHDLELRYTLNVGKQLFILVILGSLFKRWELFHYTLEGNHLFWRPGKTNGGGYTCWVRNEPFGWSHRKYHW